MASADAPQHEAKPVGEVAQIAERDFRDGSAGQPSVQRSLVH
jgi:hypothetical protein